MTTSAPVFFHTSFRLGDRADVPFSIGQPYWPRGLRRSPKRLASGTLFAEAKEMDWGSLENCGGKSSIRLFSDVAEYLRNQASERPEPKFSSNNFGNSSRSNHRANMEAFGGLFLLSTFM
jgi:hypothetical protein